MSDEQPPNRANQFILVAMVTGLVCAAVIAIIGLATVILTAVGVMKRR